MTTTITQIYSLVKSKLMKVILVVAARVNCFEVKVKDLYLAYLSAMITNDKTKALMPIIRGKVTPDSIFIQVVDEL